MLEIKIILGLLWSLVEVYSNQMWIKTNVHITNIDCFYNGTVLTLEENAVKFLK